MRNQCALFFTGNQSLVSVINKQTLKDAELMSFVRTMVLVSLKNNISTIGAGAHASFSNANSLSPAACKLATIVSDLAQPSLQPSSIPTSKRAWTLFAQFQIKLFNKDVVALPISPSVLPLFIAYLFDFKYAPFTVSTYVFAIGYSHRLSGLPESFLHSANTKGVW